MTIFKRIVVSLPLALGMGLFMSSVFALLDAYEATERYRAKTDPIVDGYARQGQVPESSAEERLDLVSDLFFIRFDMDHGSFNSIRLRVFGGILLIGLGAWISRRANVSGDIRDGRRSTMPTKEDAESGPGE
jgi:hypothetical protein